ncbi:TlpA family protein disulfide reductase [Polaribacter sp. Z014]|uniref:TlpA family protein disulfide reductase n=1 Tax=Polaribacter sp. Z014 TaxID=2927126 RepID=UPI0020209C6A|nr:TlpA disulfide reductase family protein [Polaribacter sp. Z014]MCL7762982.1 TlpA family protein disulfide reductase [Polaribacter sp. Z014]
MKKLSIVFLFLLVSTNLVSQWKYSNAKNIKDDVVITYDVVYDRVLSEKQKKLSYFKKEIIVIFNKDKLLEKRYSNSKNYDFSTLLDYDKELTYSLARSYTTKTGIINKFKNPVKDVILQEEEIENIIGIPCQVYETKIKGEIRKVYTTKKFGLRYIKQFNAQGFLLKYTANDKYLGPYTVTAKKIYYTKLPAKTYSLEGYTIRTTEEQKQYVIDAKKHSNERKEQALERLGELSPKYSVRSIQGNKFKSKDLIGKVVVLNFWFTTCPPCKKELPHLNKLKEKFKGKDVVFIAIALDDEYKIDTFLKRNPFNYDIVEDGRWIAEKFDVKAYPSNIIIDKKGNYQFYKIGYKSNITEAMSYTIEKYLKD